ncbi:hypothetical protein AFLA_002014 [Aspergillus flavus NRRL3357]|nr:hypothetical protein AFLA_002014 [Aspergillus flavus NRRL3357]
MAFRENSHEYWRQACLVTKATSALCILRYLIEWLVESLTARHQVRKYKGPIEDYLRTADRHIALHDPRRQSIVKQCSLRNTDARKQKTIRKKLKGHRTESAIQQKQISSPTHHLFVLEAIIPKSTGLKESEISEKGCTPNRSAPPGALTPTGYPARDG